MTPRSFRIILLLLGCVLALVLALQGFWLKKFYDEKTTQFDNMVRAALENAAMVIRDREAMQVVRQQMVSSSQRPRKTLSKVRSAVRSKPATVKTSSETFVFVDESHASMQMNQVTSNGSMTVVVRQDGAKPVVQILNGDSAKDVLRRHLEHAASDTLKHAVVAKALKSREIDRIMDKMVTEIQTVGSVVAADSVKAILARSLAAKGVDLPFEFRFSQPARDSATAFVRSPGFSDTLFSYRADLNPAALLSPRRFLEVQLADTGSAVMASLTGILWLSASMALFMLALFGIAVRIILRQKRLSQIRTDFINNMTHELKTPAATIRLATAALASEEVRRDDQRYKTYTSILEEESLRMNDRVERVLQASLMDSKGFVINRRMVNVREVINRAIDAMKVQLEYRNASLQIDGGEALVMSADADHLQNAIMNLIDNAVKYSPGAPQITVTVKEAGNFVTITVSDKGRGIPASDSTRVFDKFYRGHQGNRHDVKGFGLGLSYVQAVMKAHSGEVCLESAPGRGSAFTLQIPKDVQTAAG